MFYSWKLCIYVDVHIWINSFHLRKKIKNFSFHFLITKIGDSGRKLLIKTNFRFVLIDAVYVSNGYDCIYCIYRFWYPFKVWYSSRTRTSTSLDMRAQWIHRVARNIPNCERFEIRKIIRMVYLIFIYHIPISSTYLSWLLSLSFFFFHITIFFDNILIFF